MVGCFLYPEIEILGILSSELGEIPHPHFPEQAIVLYPYPFQGNHLSFPQELLCLWIRDTKGNQTCTLPAEQILNLLHPRLLEAFLPFRLHVGEIFYQGDEGDDGIAIDAGKAEEAEKGDQDPQAASLPDPASLHRQQEEAVDGVGTHGKGGKPEKSEQGHLE